MKRVLLGGVVLAAAMALSTAPAMARGFDGPHGRGEDHFGGRGYAYHDRGFRGGFGFDIAPGFGYYGGGYTLPLLRPGLCLPRSYVYPRLLRRVLLYSPALSRLLPRPPAVIFAEIARRGYCTRDGRVSTTIVLIDGRSRMHVLHYSRWLTHYKVARLETTSSSSRSNTLHAASTVLRWPARTGVSLPASSVLYPPA